MKKFFDNKVVGIIAIFIILFMFLVFIVNYYIPREFELHVWDTLLYHSNLYHLSSYFHFEGFLKTLNSIRLSIKKQEYNLFYSVFLLPFNYYFPANRYIYTYSIVCVYLPIVLILLMYFLSKQLSIRDIFWKVYILIYGLIFIPFLTPSLYGMPDIIGLIFVVLAYIFYFNKPIEERNYKELLLFSILLYLPFVLRRSYVYYIIPFIVISFVFSFIPLFLAKEQGKIKKLFKNYMFIGGIILFFLLIFQINIVKEILFYSYRDSYSFFRANDYIVNFKNLIYKNGAYIILMSAIGVILGVFSKYRKLSLFIVFNLAISFFLFNYVQTMGIQHNLQLLSVGFFLLNIMAVYLVTNLFFKNIITKKIVAIVLLFFHFSFFCFTFKIIDIKNFGDYIARGYFISDATSREHEKDIILLARGLEKFFSEHDDKYLYLTTSYSISRDHFLSYYFFYDIKNLKKDKFSGFNNPPNYIKNSVWYGDIDERDRLVNTLFQVKYIVVNLNPEKELPGFFSQKIINIPFYSLINNNNIGRAFKKINFEVDFKNGSKFVIYEKKRKMTKQEITEFLNEINSYYPSWNIMSKVDEFFAAQ